MANYYKYVFFLLVGPHSKSKFKYDLTWFYYIVLVVAHLMKTQE